MSADGAAMIDRTRAIHTCLDPRDGAGFVTGQGERPTTNPVDSSRPSNAGLGRKTPVPSGCGENGSSAASGFLDDPARVACVGLPCRQAVLAATRGIQASVNCSRLCLKTHPKADESSVRPGRMPSQNWERQGCDDMNWSTSSGSSCRNSYQGKRRPADRQQTFDRS